MDALVDEELKKAELAVCKAPTKVRGMLKSERAYEGLCQTAIPGSPCSAASAACHTSAHSVAAPHSQPEVMLEAYVLRTWGRTSR
jgi:hypothetical protein